ncbi:MFS transporter [Paenibacillus radicis (ex Xue et al. 2023)]|uniref:MFS transporter n=1 Tax=Paenibacillus radicis (ex Xue et al. 2023) TaxID=2972489 RepID=A0ABT1YVD5_9BACL|nr:MFS transporter [Paenibacillus radicis (ex Xue et al. 2023)]MCR8636893.1 MFS transporter [Paenibacillus radicis (ex Xue et al. 2023)]
MITSSSALSDGRPSAPAPSEGSKQVRIIAWVTAICLLGDSMYYIVLPLYWKHFGLDALWQVGFLLSINRFVRLPLNPLVGWLYSRMSKRLGVMLAVLLACLTTIGYGCLSGFTALLIARALWGAAWSLLRIGGYLTVLEASSDSNRGQLLGSYNGIIAFGSLIGMLAGGVLADVIGVRPIALLLGVVMLAGIPFAWKHVPSSRGTEAVAAVGTNKDSKKSLSQRWSSALTQIPAAFWLVLASGTGTAIVFFGIYLSTLSAVIEAHLPGTGGTITLLGATLGAASVAGIVQAIRWAWSPYLSPRIGAWSDGPRGRLPLYTASLAIAAVTLALLPLKLPFAAWLSLLLVAQLANTAIVTLTDALAADASTGSSRVAYMTTYTTVVDVGAALGPLLGFALLGQLGLAGLYQLCAALLLVLAALSAAAIFRARVRA